MTKRMLRWLLPLALLSSVAAAGQQPDAFVTAYLAEDTDEFERLAQVVGDAELSKRLGARERLSQLSAIEVARRTSDPSALLSALAEAADGRDRSVCIGATRAAVSITMALNQGVIENKEIDLAVLAAALTHWRRIVEDQGRWADVRVHALEISHRLAGLTNRKDALAFLLSQIKSGEPELRRAALELLPQPLDVKTRAAAIGAISDKHDLVSAAAAGAICQAITAGDAPAPIRDALGQAGTDKLRALHKASPTWLEPATKRHIAACVGAGGTD